MNTEIRKYQKQSKWMEEKLTQIDRDFDKWAKLSWQSLKQGDGKMKIGQVEIKLHNLDKIDVGEYILTDGNIHKLYSGYLDGPEVIDTNRLKSILRDHANVTYADLGVLLLS